MGNVISWYPRQNNRLVLFEVTDLEGHAMWGGEPPAEAIDRKSTRLNSSH